MYEKSLSPSKIVFREEYTIISKIVIIMLCILLSFRIFRTFSLYVLFLTNIKDKIIKLIQLESTYGIFPNGNAKI